MAVSRKGHRPALQTGHCNTCVKYFFTAFGLSQGGLVTSRLNMTPIKFFWKTDVAFPCDTMKRTKPGFECGQTLHTSHCECSSVIHWMMILGVTSCQINTWSLGVYNVQEGVFSVWPVQPYLLNVLQEGDQVTCWWQQTRVHVTPDRVQGFSEEAALNHRTNVTDVCFHHLKGTKSTNGVGEERKTTIRGTDGWKGRKKARAKG